ncbi:MAG: glycosyltransferase [Propionibacteriaceae bacterium]|jgi:glycosyltransferase EpsJ|nr:glycosyltransferase [Propionibacteriaceae bacterium]
MPEPTQQPSVSIIMPVFNAEHTLDVALASATTQSLPSIEIVCVDDGSTDASREILDRWAARDARIHILAQANSGVSASRNLALDRVQGEFVLFLDSDDWIEEHTAELLLARARTHGSDIVTYGGVCFPGAGWPQRYLDTRDFEYDDTRAALLGEVGAYPLVNKLVKRSLVEDHQLRFDTALALGEDHAFWFCAFPHARKVSFVADKLYHYRWNETGSAVQRVGSQNSRVWSHLEMVRAVCEYWRAQEFFSGYEPQFLAWLAELLFRDATMLPRSERELFAMALGVEMQRSGLSAHLSAADADTQYTVHAMLQASGIVAKLRLEAQNGGLASLGSMLRRRLGR